MRLSVKLVLATAIALCSRPLIHAQDLSARAYVINPVHSNAAVLTRSFFNGTMETLRLLVPRGLATYQSLAIVISSTSLAAPPMPPARCPMRWGTSTERCRVRSSTFTAGQSDGETVLI